MIKVPALPVRPDPLFDFDVSSSDGTRLFLGQYVASQSDPFSASKRGSMYDEHISMVAPDGTELTTLVVGKPPDKVNVEAHIKYGVGFGGKLNTGFGIIRKNPQDPKHPYEVVGLAPLSVSTNDAEGTNRTLRIFDLSNNQFKECATATCYITGQGKAWYEVTCNANADMLYVSMTIIGVDRVSSKELGEIKMKMWK